MPFYGNDTNNDQTGGAYFAMYGGDGNDRLSTTSNGAGIPNEVDGGRGADYLYFEGTASGTIDGGNNNDAVFGYSGADNLYGGEGDDFVTETDLASPFIPASTNTSSDHLYGGGGADGLYGGGGDDFLYGGDGNDQGPITTANYTTVTNNLVDAAHNAGLFGGDGNDSIYGGDGNDGLHGQAGNDIEDGGAGDDQVDGGPGEDVLLGGLGNDTMQGGPGNDTMYGGADNDTLSGGDDNDTIYGGTGNDLIHGQLGNDILKVGDGSDQVFFDTALDPVNNVDTIRDFEVGIDKIVLSQAIFTGSHITDGTLSNGEFFIGKKAHDGNDTIIYNANNGKLFYDDDGKGGDAKVQFALLDKHLDLHASDFVIVA